VENTLIQSMSRFNFQEGEINKNGFVQDVGLLKRLKKKNLADTKVKQEHGPIKGDMCLRKAVSSWDM
jgi:hypothetical protein